MKNENSEKKESKNNEKIENNLEDDFENDQEEEEIHTGTNTLEQANEILLKFNQRKTDKNSHEEEEDDEDLDDYIKNLEN